MASIVPGPWSRLSTSGAFCSKFNHEAWDKPRAVKGFFLNYVDGLSLKDADPIRVHRGETAPTSDSQARVKGLGFRLLGPIAVGSQYMGLLSFCQTTSALP